MWGLGKPVVDGTVTPDTYVISRRPGKGILSVRIAPKLKRIVATDKGGPAEQVVPTEMQTRACLTDDQIMTISDYLPLPVLFATEVTTFVHGIEGYEKAARAARVFFGKSATGGAWEAEDPADRFGLKILRCAIT